MTRLLALLVLTMLACVPGSAWAAQRVALLIGNSAYAQVPRLANPARDVALLRQTFTAAGFDDIEIALDADRDGMIAALRRFEDKARSADIAVIYYSGHGLETGGENYLVPTDAHLKSDRYIQDEALPLSRVVQSTEGARRLKLVILDACRDNPFVPSMSKTRGTRSVGKGLARVEPDGDNVLVAYAAREGSVALDGSGVNSPYALALSRFLATPGLDVRLALGKVRDDVLRTTGQQQMPFFNGSLGGDVIALAGGGDGTAQATVAEPPAPPAVARLEPVAPARTRPAFPVPVHEPSPLIGSVVTGVDMPGVLQEARDRYRGTRLAGEAEAKLKLLLGVEELDPLPPEAADATPAPETECDRIGATGLGADTVMRRVRAATPKEIAAACEAAVKQFPRERRFMQQLGDALVLTGDKDRGLEWNLRAGIAGSQRGWISAAQLFLARVRPYNPAGNYLHCLNISYADPVSRIIMFNGSLSGPPPRIAPKKLAALASKAEKGDRAAAVWLGYVYLLGSGAPVDYARAMAWFDKAGLGGAGDTRLHLGLLLRYGEGMRARPERAIEAFRDAIKAGNPYASFLLASMYMDGDGVPQNYAAAARMMVDAAVAGDARSINDLIAGFGVWPREYAVVLQQELLKRGVIRGRADGALSQEAQDDLRKLAEMAPVPVAATP